MGQSFLFSYVSGIVLLQPTATVLDMCPTVSLTVHPHCCQTLDCCALLYFPLLILPQNPRWRFHSEVARRSPALTLAAASCNGSLSGTGRSFSEAAIRVCSRWQLPVKARAKGRFRRNSTAVFPLYPQDTHEASSGDPDLPHCPDHPHLLNSLLLTASYTISTRRALRQKTGTRSSWQSSGSE